MRRADTKLPIVPAVIAGLLMVFPLEAVAQSSGCLAPDDTSSRIADWTGYLLTDTTAAAGAERDTLGVVGVQPSQVTAITDTRTCSKIVDAFNRFEGVTRSNRRVYAYNVGSDIVAQDPNFKSGEWTPLLFLDRTYKVIRSYMVF